MRESLPGRRRGRSSSGAACTSPVVARTPSCRRRDSLGIETIDMDEKQARDLGDRLRRGIGKSADVEELHGDDARDFVFVADRPVLVGTFKVTAPGLRPFFVSLVSSSGQRQHKFQLFVMEKRKGSPVLGTNRYDGTNLVWRYNPTKQSGDNAKRKAEFVRLANTDAIAIPLPDEDIRPFAEQINRALTLRHQADAAGGAIDGEPDEAGDDDEPSDGPSFWKIAPGEVGGEWPRCLDKQIILIGWKELGDLSGIDEAEFDRRAAAAKKEHDWGEGVSQVWKFRNIRVGDRIVANAGTKRVLGIGTVIGPYQFVPGVEYPHQLPVRWDEVEPRVVDMPGWRRTLIRLSEHPGSVDRRFPFPGRGGNHRGQASRADRAAPRSASTGRFASTSATRSQPRHRARREGAEGQ